MSTDISDFAKGDPTPVIGGCDVPARLLTDSQDDPCPGRMSEHDRERSYINGRKSMAARIISQCMHEIDPEEKEKAQLLIERQEAVAMLRQVCDEHGDNDWPDELHLADIIEKHLWRNLKST